MKAMMVCLGLEPRAAGWKAQTNPLCYGGTPKRISLQKYESRYGPKIREAYYYVIASAM